MWNWNRATTPAARALLIERREIRYEVPGICLGRASPAAPRKTRLAGCLERIRSAVPPEVTVLGEQVGDLERIPVLVERELPGSSDELRVERYGGTRTSSILGEPFGSPPFCWVGFRRALPQKTQDRQQRQMRHENGYLANS
jgi:hypothetical protein